MKLRFTSPLKSLAARLALHNAVLFGVALIAAMLTIKGAVEADAPILPALTGESIVALAFLIGVTVMIAADAEARVCLYVAAGWAVALGVGWTVLKKGNPTIADRDEDRFEKVG